MQTLRPPWVLTQARAHRPVDRAWRHFSSATRRPAIWVWPTRPPGRARADDGLPAVLQRQDRTECALADVPASFAARPPELLVRRAANRLSQQRGCRAERRLRARSAQQLSVTHRDGHCWGRPGCRGTTRGTGTSRTSVQCVLSGHSLAASVQVERPERPVGPLLIRGFGVRVPGGAPVPTSTKPCRQSGSLLCRGANRSAASLHTLPTAHHRRTRTVILPGWLPRRACVRRRPRTAGAAASRLRCAGKQIDYESEMPIRSSPMVSLFILILELPGIRLDQGRRVGLGRSEAPGR